MLGFCGGGSFIIRLPAPLAAHAAEGGGRFGAASPGKKKQQMEKNKDTKKGSMGGSRWMYGLVGLVPSNHSSSAFTS